MSVNSVEYSKALKSLKEAVSLEECDISRDASIQRFEFTVELAWKTSKKLMGTSTTAPKQVVREMAQNGIIDDVEIWLEAINMRNLSSHTYNESLAKEVYSFIKKFISHAEKLEKNFK